MKINHIGIAVHSIDEALKFFRDTLKLSVSGIEEIEDEGVRVAILPLGETRLELLEPLHEKSPLHRFLKKRGAGFHHLAFSTQKLQKEIKRLSQSGIKVLGPPRQGARKTQITFVHPKDTHGVLIELCEEPPEQEP